MISGLGFFEILVILVIVLLFFGSRELPKFVRDGARLLAKARRYSDKVRREMEEIARPLEETRASFRDETGEKKKVLRKRFIAARRDLAPETRADKSTKILEILADSSEYGAATAVMLYVATTTEVQTRGMIERALADGKRVVLPYCKAGSRDLGIGEIRNLETDVSQGTLMIAEPIVGLRDNFLRSDLGLVVVPGVAFDRHGGRLGRGKAYYDNFLRELKGRTPLFGLAYRCQITDEVLPFDYHDVSVDQVLTEEGALFVHEETS